MKTIWHAIPEEDLCKDEMQTINLQVSMHILLSTEENEQITWNENIQKQI